MIIRSVNLETVCGATSRLPENRHPEFAFAGRSNVGKSSLINALMNRRSYARISQQPGKTQTINYYNVNDEMYLVDLPGYGYAKAGGAAKAEWGRMIENYLNTSKQLRMVFLLVDIRHAPNANDCQMFDWVVRSGFEPVVIATKLDKIRKNQVSRQCGLVRETLGMRQDELLIPFSAETKQGREEIWTLLEKSSGSEAADQEAGYPDENNNERVREEHNGKHFDSGSLPESREL